MGTHYEKSGNFWYYPVNGRQNTIFAHEMGHVFGLSDEYCSRESGSTDSRCNGPDSVNRLTADQGCSPLTGDDCCNIVIPNQAYNIENGIIEQTTSSLPSLCVNVDYGVCCLGNAAYINGQNDPVGRSIMSYSSAPGPRAYSKSAYEYLSTKLELNC
ncbi:MAG: hypothetical protein HZB67_02725 [Candidatus Aenigmarchaeota archaeon]|nr:hypothetical protein [Candidatus Aenigmarchaeota archaeon]